MGVSIPIGFSGSLQQSIVAYQLINSDVSIPIGFSGSLQLGSFALFASRTTCFNPYRVFWFAATCEQPPWNAPYSVSIPIGFSGSLQPKSLNFCRPISKGFNPYRVFWFAATLILRSEEIPRTGFNPYRVFWFAATSGLCRSSSAGPRFQSLSGFLVRCNQRSGHSERSWIPSFNPYRVFWFAATKSRSISRSSSNWFQSLSGFLVRCNGGFGTEKAGIQ